MCIKFILLLTTLLAYSPIFAQTKILDSLQAELVKKTVVDTNYIKLQNNIAFHFLLENNNEKAMQNAQIALEFSEKNNFEYGKAMAYYVICYVYYNQEKYVKAINFGEKAFLIGEKNNFNRDLVAFSNVLGNSYFQRSVYDKALEKYIYALRLNEKFNDLARQASNHNNIGLVQKDLKQYKEAIKSFEKSIELCLKTKNFGVLTKSYNNVGVAYEKLLNDEKALFYFNEALKINTQQGKKSGMAVSYINIGNLLHRAKKYAEAIQSFETALIISIEIKNKNYEATTKLNIGASYGELKEFSLAYHNLNEALEIAKSIQSIDLEMSIYMAYAAVYEIAKNTEKAYQYFKMYIGVKDSIFSKENSEQIAKIQTIYETEQKEAENLLLRKDNDLKAALLSTQILKEQKIRLEAFEKEQQNQLLLAENLIKESTIEKQHLEQKKVVAEKESKEKENELLKKDKAFQDAQAQIKNEELRFQKFINYVFLGGLLFLVLIVALIVRFIYIQKKQNKLLKEKNKEILDKKDQIEAQNAQLIVVNEEVLQQKEEITIIAENLQTANDEVYRQKYLVEQKNTKITSSINYAKRIQETLMPAETELKQFFEEHFLFFKPKDIVSGDFYWVKNLNIGTKTYTIVVVADCTGHGVPGALISMIGMNHLEEIVAHQKTFMPNEILTKLHSSFKETLRPDETGTYDGMDLTIICIEKDKNQAVQIYFAGAMNYLICQNPNEEAQTWKGDKSAIGGKSMHKSNTEFVIQQIPYTPNMTIYMLTDGLQDQFGGENNKKLGLKNLKNLFSTHSHLPMKEQGEKLSQFFKEWQGNESQIDDITLLAIKI